MRDSNPRADSKESAHTDFPHGLHMSFAPLETHAYRIRLGLERCIAELYRSFKSLFAPDPLKLFRALFAR
jgi:hypothetical protein